MGNVLQILSSDRGTFTNAHGLTGGERPIAKVYLFKSVITI